MPSPETVFPDVKFDFPFVAEEIEYDKQLGFYTLTEQQVAVQGLRLSRVVLGFGAPLSRQGGFDTSLEVTPLTDFADLHPSDRTIDLQGKGVGPRMYNTPQAALGLTEVPPEIGAFTFDLNISTLHDTRDSEGGKLARIGRHGARIIRSKFSGVESVVADIHESYGDAEAVLFTQPPRAELRQNVERHAKAPEGVPPEFIIIRNAAITLHRIGNYKV